HAADLDHDPAWRDAGGPVVDRPLALTHPDFRRLVGHRHVREDADPHPALTLHLAGDGPTGGLDLASGDPLRLHRLQPVGAEIQGEAALRHPLDAALERLAVLGLLPLKHVALPYASALLRRSRRATPSNPPRPPP